MVLKRTKVPSPSNRSSCAIAFVKDLNDQFRIVEGAIFQRLENATVNKVADKGPGLARKATKVTAT